MDRGLISLKFAMLRNSSRGLRLAGWFIGAALVVATWRGPSLAVNDDVRHDVITLLFASWLIGGMLGPVLMSGAGILRPDYFALLPVRRSALGRGLLVSVFVGVASGYLLLAMLSNSWHAVILDPATLAIAVPGAVLAWIFVITLSRLVYGLLGAAMRSRLGIEIAGVQWGIVLAAMFAGWMMVVVAFQSIPQLLERGLPDGPVTVVLDALPTSWPVLAVESAAAGNWGTAVGLLAALAALDVLCILATIALLVPRSQRVSPRRGRPRSVALVAGGGLLPATPTGAVIMKELRQWRRDPWRALESSTAIWTGVTIGVFALLGPGTAPVGAFAGVIVAAMLALAACNLYGQDGTAVWQNVVGESPSSVRADVRGRQWALALVFLPRALVVSAIFVVIAQAWWAIPLVLAALPALVGAASGAAVLTSAIGVSPGVDPRRRVGPNDANGNLSLQVWIALLVTTIGVLPAAGAIVWAGVSGSIAVAIAAAAIGIASGFGSAWLFGRIAIGYLDTRFVDVFSRIRYGRVFRDRSSGLLDALEARTLADEEKAAEYKRKEREKRTANARA
ncbi:ABC-2 type transport system permease protein [Microbacteriaceae bacterium SG_E_30_P1]|uniref:ABC-2 type transport system permease protein n=1 Tax=Antiquaquibacter oligotrophicus TaxID=2880260 RepID=A0ABT6KPD5_9MICO|nr:hypothetical protein [Antiquaquibacter oligotrophicus]MDH6181850.1 ABC-2 type transport system permease protein [Antiquaquibacter oligotrophicus]UDF12473.1 hypothetical protein LH407_09935 [Antiquaquibacter oligotrophicus]